MKRKAFKNVVIALLVLEIPMLYLTFRSFANRDKDITKVSYDENIKTKSTLAYYIDGKLQEGMTSWPTDKEYEKAECYYGNHVEVPASEVLSFDDTSHTATITSNKTIYCSLYFGKTPAKPSDLGEAARLIDKNSSGGTLESVEQLAIRNETIGEIKDDLRRFRGTKDEVIDNFICFGIDDQQTCKDNMDLYMYRIIGIDTQGKLKLIKATNIGSSRWAGNKTTDVKWSESTLKKNLNGSSFSTNSKYSYMQNQKWANLIDPNALHYTGIPSTNSIPTLFQDERKEAISGVSNKISLMNASDNVYAGNWLYISNGLNSSGSKLEEWTMDYGQPYWTGAERWYYAKIICESGSICSNAVDESAVMRPVFYLKSDVKISGEGIIYNPYIISIE